MGATVNMPAFPNLYMDFDWAPLDVPMEDMGDFKSVDWAIRQLGRRHEKPFFLACGIYRPHNPWYVPRKFYEMFPLESVKLPLVLENDLADVGDRAREIAHRGGGYHRHVIEAGLWKNAVQGYLAAIAFADELLGRLLDALERSPYAANTIVAAWSDHGWQLGEKEHWRKFALWENVVRNVLMIKAPPGLPGLRGGAAAGRRTDRIVSLGDLHPTLLELAGIPLKTDMEYRSLVPLLKEPDRPWDHPALTTYDFSEFSVRVEGWRYTRYIDDSEELYDHRTDPEDWTNLAGDSRFQDVKKRLAGMIPDMQAPYPKTSYKIQPHHLPPFKSKEEYRAAKAAEARGEGRKPVPEADPWTIQVRDY
jgi:arylsulfatase A-like enzyme